MSRPNPTVITCVFCDQPQAPGSSLCADHLEAEEEKRERLKSAIAEVKLAHDFGTLMRATSKVDQPLKNAEFNFPAEIIMQIGAMTPNLPAILKSAEEAMLQLAFFNAGENPPCSFIMAAFEAGWRYRIDKGFYQVTA